MNEQNNFETKPENSKLHQENLDEVLKKLLKLKDQHKSGRILNVPCRDFFITVGEEYQKFFAKGELSEVDKKELESIISLLSLGENNLISYNKEIGKSESDQSQKRKTAEKYFHGNKKIKSLDHIMGSIHSTILQALANSLGKEDPCNNKPGCSIDDTKLINMGDHSSRALMDIAEFLERNKKLIIEKKSEFADNNGIQELDLAIKVLSHPKLYYDCHEIDNLTEKRKRNVDGNNAERLFNGWQKKGRVIDWLPLWLRDKFS